jgi:hypothetical protein
VKRNVVAGLILLLLTRAGSGVVIWTLEAPGDDEKIRAAALDGPAVRAFRDRFNEIQERRLWPLDVSQIAAALGPKLDSRPERRVLPIFQSTCLALSGLYSIGQPDLKHVDFHRVGNIGYLELHYHQNGRKLETALLWFQPDSDFVPLKSLDDLTRRLDWELRKFELFQKWLDQHLPK